MQIFGLLPGPCLVERRDLNVYPILYGKIWADASRFVSIPFAHREIFLENEKLFPSIFVWLLRRHFFIAMSVPIYKEQKMIIIILRLDFLLVTKISVRSSTISLFNVSAKLPLIILIGYLNRAVKDRQEQQEHDLYFVRIITFEL